MRGLAAVLLLGILLGCTGAPQGSFVCLNGSLADSLSECAGVADKNISQECLLPPGLSCSAKLSTDGYLTLRVRNAMPGEIVVTGLYCSSKARDVRLLPAAEWTKMNKSIPQAGATDLVPVPCRNEAGENRQFNTNESFEGVLFIRHHFTIMPEEVRIAVGELQLKAQ